MPCESKQMFIFGWGSFEKKETVSISNGKGFTKELKFQPNGTKQLFANALKEKKEDPKGALLALYTQIETVVHGSSVEVPSTLQITNSSSVT